MRNDLWLAKSLLTHCGRVTHICVGILTITGSDNGFSPGRRQAIIWTSDAISPIGHLGTNFSEILIEIHTFSFEKMSSGKLRPFCLGLNVLNTENGTTSWNHMVGWENIFSQMESQYRRKISVYWIRQEVISLRSCFYQQKLTKPTFSSGHGYIITSRWDVITHPYPTFPNVHCGLG